MLLKASKHFRAFQMWQSKWRLFGHIASKHEMNAEPYRHEPILQYKRRSVELYQLENALMNFKSTVQDIPIVINGQKINTDKSYYQYMPHSKKHTVAKYCYATEKHINQAIEQACVAQKKWNATALSKRISIWDSAADLMAKRYRADLVASIMLSQSKTLIEAERDVVRLIDSTRLNAAFLRRLAQLEMSQEQTNECDNSVRFRGLDGFIAAFSPFYSTETAANLAYGPALMGCSVLWKPSNSAILSNWLVFQIMRQAGIPDGVVNFVPADETIFSNTISFSPWLSGISYAGARQGFHALTKSVAKYIQDYKQIPRIVSDCSVGRSFHFVHRSADVETAMPCTLRAAFEYSGQKPGSCSHLFVSEVLWNDVLMSQLVQNLQSVIVGDVCNYKAFLSAVINEKAYTGIFDFLEHTKMRNKGTLISGGMSCSLRGFFVDPTVIVVRDPKDQLLQQSISGPILIVHPYRDRDVIKSVEMIKNFGSVHSGAVFATDIKFLTRLAPRLRSAAINFAINDMCTEHKLGWPNRLLQWIDVQSIKEYHKPRTELFYPYMNM